MIKRKISFSTVKISALAKKYIGEVIKNNRISYGPFLSRFEREFANLHDRKFGITSSSGTASLQVALATLKELHRWKDGDEVLVPAVTFIATSNIVLQNGLRPVFVDVDSKTYNMDPTKIEEKISSKTRCIIPVHLFGLSADMEPIMKIAKRKKLKVIEDACETVVVKYKNKPVGSGGDIACFSTYAAHIVVTGVGGIALTDNNDYALVMKSMVNHGRDSIYLNIDDDDNLKADAAVFKMANRRFSFLRMGYSHRLTEFEGALGLAELSGVHERIKKLQKNSGYMIDGLAPYSSFLQFPSWPKHSEHAFMMFPLVIKDTRVSRDDLITFLEKNGIETRYMMPLLNQPFYVKMFGNLENKYPVARWINKNGFCIGCHQDLTRKDLDYVMDVFGNFFKKWI